MMKVLGSVRAQFLFQPTKKGPVYVRVRRSETNTTGRYGNYSLSISAAEVGPEAPNIQISAGAVQVTLAEGQSVERTVVITNTGTVDTLVYRLEEQERNGAQNDFPWLSLGPQDQGLLAFANRPQGPSG